MKKVLKKFGAALLTMTMGISMFAMQAFAEPITAANNTMKVTVANLEEKAEVSIYQIIDVNHDPATGTPTTPAYSWTKAEYAAVTGITAEAMAAWEDQNAVDMQAISNALMEHLRKVNRDTDDTNNIAPVKGPITVAEGATSVEVELGLGVYLILVDGGIAIYQPTCFNISSVFVEGENEGEEGAWHFQLNKANTDEGTVNLKRNDPIVKKEADEVNGDVGIGDVVHYTLTVAVPSYPDNAVSKKFFVGDLMSKGLTWDSTSVVVKHGDVVLTENTHYTLVYDTNGGTSDMTVAAGKGDNGGNTKAVTFYLQFDCDNLKGDDFDYTTGDITVTYSAMINGDAATDQVDPVTNQAILTYNNDPYNGDSYETKIPDPDKPDPDDPVVDIYTYGIEIENQKKNPVEDGDPYVTLDEADDKYEVYKVTKEEDAAAGDGSTKNVETKLSFVPMLKKDADGNLELDGENKTIPVPGQYRLATPAEILAGRDEHGNEVVTEVDTVDGFVTVYGLSLGDYKLVETKVPDGGYNKVADIEVTLAPHADDKGVLEDDTDNIYNAKAPHSKGFQLPTTGGMGTVLFTVGGSALIAGAAVLLLLASRKKKVQAEG